MNDTRKQLKELLEVKEVTVYEEGETLVLPIYDETHLFVSIKGSAWGDEQIGVFYCEEGIDPTLVSMFSSQFYCNNFTDLANVIEATVNMLIGNK
jgi:hypothetical protein